MSFVPIVFKHVWPPQRMRAWVRGRLKACQAGLRRLHNPYRPESHYMRGRGPKWHQKNDSTR
jgi:hypothetical protein